MDTVKCKIMTATNRQKAISKDTLQKFVEIETKTRRYVLQEGYVSNYSCVVYEKREHEDQALEVDGDFSLQDGLGYMMKQIIKFEGMSFNEIR